MEKVRTKLVPMPAWTRRNVEWPSVVFFFVLMAVFAFSWIGFFLWRGPMWVISPLVNIACVYASFTVLHEAAHKNIFRDRDSYGNDILGLIAGIAMHGAFEQFIGIHLKHHASVNIPEEDPDLHAKGPVRPSRLLVWMFTVPHYFYEFTRLKLMRGRNLFLLVLPYVFLCGLYVAAYVYNLLPELLLLYTLPAGVGACMTVFVFDYLPHHPHADTTRYGNATVYDVPKWNWFFMGHSFHIVHHLWPSIPWYRYRDVYHQAREQLKDAGVREATVKQQIELSL